MDNCPCIDCESRSARCHAECPDYAAWSAVKNAVRERDHKIKRCEGEYVDHVQKVVHAIKVRNKGGRKLNGWK